MSDYETIRRRSNVAKRARCFKWLLGQDSNVLYCTTLLTVAQ